MGASGILLHGDGMPDTAAAQDHGHDGEEARHQPFTLLLSGTEEDDVEIQSFQGFYTPWWKTCIFYLVALCTCGISLLVCKWSPRVHILLSLAPCDLKRATTVRITLVDGRVDLVKVTEVQALRDGEAAYDSQPTMNADQEDGRNGLLDWQAHGSQRLLEYRCTRYFYLDSMATFVPVPGVPQGFNEQLQRTATQMAALGKVMALDEPDWELEDRQMRYGLNEMRIPVKSIGGLIFDEMWHPFYVFQYFSIIIWIVGDQYYSYSVCIAVITWFSIISSAMESHQNMKRLSEIAHFRSEVQVIRAGSVLTVPSSELVPGDLVVVAPGTLPCDLVLLRGECIVDENMLTGESVPVRKVVYSPVSDGLTYNPDKCPGCTLFGGTMVAQARGTRGQKAIAVACRTGFYSAKGQLLRSILFPREHSESFISDSLRFICVMLVICIGLYIWAAVVLAEIGASADRIVVRFFDMITIAVPPALPACLTIATVFSIGRLRKRGIYVTSPDRITVAGQLDVICFDKTGTLTEQGLDLQGIVPIVGGRIHNMVVQMQLLPLALVELLAACHGLARMGDSLVGDPLDQKLFLATHWDLIDERASGDAAEGPGASLDALTSGAAADSIDGPMDWVRRRNPTANGSSGAEDPEAGVTSAEEATGTSVAVHSFVRPPGAAHAYAIIKRFEFNAALQRNLVVVRAPDASVAVFAKGSPEAIRTLVAPDSVPPDFERLLGELTREGLRVLALAAGDGSGVPEQRLMGWTQDETERGVVLRLVGLAVMANPLRPDTADVIAQLQHANIRTVMVTGDHLRTAISVAHKCNILPLQRPILLVDGADQPGSGAPTGHVTPSGPGPAGEPTINGDPSARATPSLAAGHMPGSPMYAGGAATAANGGTPPALGSPVAAQLARASGLRLSVLDVDGSVIEGGLASSLVPSMMSGELECAVTGKGFNWLLSSLDPQLLVPVLQRGAVFARMSPDNKRDLMLLLGNGIEMIESCPHLNLRAGFCGDGANDCGALKAAHVGVSLCEAEASVAAPMTSKAQTIASMILVVSEGRCALMATYQIFQFIIAYALVQAFETNLMYTYALNLGNYQYLIEDLFFTTVLAALMGFTEPRSKLSRSKPLPRVLSAPLVISTCAQLAMIIIFQLAGLAMLKRQPGYVAFRGGPELRDTVAPENTTTYIIALSQFIVLALVFNKGRPHRSPIWTNLYLVLALLIQIAFVLFSLFSTGKFNQEVQQLVDKSGVMDMAFRWKLFGLLVTMGVTAIVLEYMSMGIVKIMDWARGVPGARNVHGSGGKAMPPTIVGMPRPAMPEPAPPLPTSMRAHGGSSAGDALSPAAGPQFTLQ